jgi:acetyltransferase/esterase
MDSEQGESHFMDVPGACLYYEKLGTGPVLVLVTGASETHNIWSPLRQNIKDHFTVITYDRRGFSQSKLDGEQDYDRRLETDADDVQRLIHRVSDTPAFVLGSSSGAIVTLKFLERHPESAKMVVLHEPPLYNLLPDAEKWKEFFFDIYDTYQQSGIPPAIEKFTSMLKNRIDAEAMKRGMTGAIAEQTKQNTIYWFEHELRQYSSYLPKMDAIKRSADKMVLFVGEKSKGDFPSLPANELAKSFYKSISYVPGGHIGMVYEVDGFATGVIKAFASQ